MKLKLKKPKKAKVMNLRSLNEYGSSDPDEIEIDFGNSPIAAFPFEQKFEFEELLQLADKIAPKAEPESEDETTQSRARPGEAVQSADDRAVT